MITEMTAEHHTLCLLSAEQEPTTPDHVTDAHGPGIAKATEDPVPTGQQCLHVCRKRTCWPLM